MGFIMPRKGSDGGTLSEKMSYTHNEIQFPGIDRTTFIMGIFFDIEFLQMQYPVPFG